MGKLAVYKYVTLMCLIIQIVITIFTFVGLFGGNVPPQGNTARAMLVYILPLLIVLNIIMLIIWLIRRNWIISALPLITILCCIPYIGTQYQFRGKASVSETRQGITIATYNVAKFGHETSGFMAQDILSEMKKQSVDILCLQEYTNTVGDKMLSDSYRDYFPYAKKGNDDMVIYSRYPIGDSKNIPFEQTNNSAMWADVSIAGFTVRVFNVHLETTGFSRTLHQVAKLENKGYNVESNALLKAIYNNYTIGMIARAGQANVVAMERLKCTTPVIICGDFNDVPYSYVYNTLKHDMVDGFKECGSGFMRTYRGKKPVRIDYIFHDKSMKGITYYTVPLAYSDHLPVFMKVEM